MTVERVFRLVTPPLGWKHRHLARRNAMPPSASAAGISQAHASGHGFTAWGRGSLLEVLCQGTTSVVPIRSFF